MPANDAGGRFRYRSWREGPDPLAPPFDVRAVVDELGDSLMTGSSLRDALDRLRHSGTRDTPGIDELHRRIARQRRELSRRGDLTGALSSARAALDQALAAERETLAGADDDEARLAEMTLDALPDTVAAAMRELQDYAWRNPEAAAAFRAISEQMRDQLLDQQFGGLKQALQSQDPAALRRIKDMMADLNQLLADHARGTDTPEQFEEFMDRHGDFFPEQPRDVDELIDQLAKRQAAAERLLRSLSREQRAELEDLMQQAIGTDPDLASELAQLQDNLTALRPGMMRGQGFNVDGDQPLDYGEAAGVMGELADLEDLETQLSQQYPGATLDDIDVENVERQLGADAARDLRALRDLERELERQGYLRRTAEGLSLSPKALRRLGQSALKRIFADLNAHGAGGHDDRRTGAADERTGAFLPWEFGGEQPIDAVRTVTNAVLRRAAGDGPGTLPTSLTLGVGPPLRLEVEDFVIAETERRTTAAVALCVDLSFSMVMEDRWLPMKQTALALTHLIGTRFRQDALEIIGFDRTARVLSAMELAEVEPEWVKGTNLQHALMLATRHLRRHPEAEPVILVITDGEPTASLQDGFPVFSWPPTPQIIADTVTEVDAVARLGATLNIFRLGEDPGLARFVDAMAKRAGGRVFAPSTDRLGEYVVSDYLRARRGRHRRAG
ncbi:vWA domain-containing protein [Nakamurella lactea]|uniref:hypothetical protein n=1 Tax=Nakamurella lactea TaxID=459515 RepID=UPI00040F578B|nr:hypothetical protein [Nakamurella lactea]